MTLASLVAWLREWWPLLLAALALADFILGRTKAIKPNSTIEAILHGGGMLARGVLSLFRPGTAATLTAIERAASAAEVIDRDARAMESAPTPRAVQAVSRTGPTVALILALATAATLHAGCSSATRTAAGKALDEMGAQVSASVQRTGRLAKAGAACAAPMVLPAVKDAALWALAELWHLADDLGDPVRLGAAIVEAVKDIGRKLLAKYGPKIAGCVVERAADIYGGADRVPKFLRSALAWLDEHAVEWGAPVEPITITVTPAGVLP